MHSTATERFLQLIIFFLNACVFGFNLGVQDFSTFHNLGIRDVIFSDEVVFETDVRSKLDCVRRCFRHECCVGWSYFVEDTGTLQGICRGYGAFPNTITSSASVRKAAMTYSFQRKSSAWGGKPCIVNADCPGEKMAECFKGQCLCVPGYYYSHGRDSCIDACPSCRLAPSYLVYRDSSFIIDIDYITPANLDGQACLDACIHSGQPTCRAVGYDPHLSTKCYMKELAPWTPRNIGIRTTQAKTFTRERALDWDLIDVVMIVLTWHGR